MISLQRKYRLLLLLISGLAILAGGFFGGELLWNMIASPPLPPVKSSLVQTKSAVVSPTASPSAPKQVQENANLVIPRLGINAPIEAVGIRTGNVMDVPAQHPWSGVGWYKYGPYPGEPGSAVIDGHLDRPGGFPAVFWELHLLRVGDRIMVVAAGKRVLIFRVVATAFYQPASAPLKRIFRRSGGVFLNLITCAGQWIPSQHQTTHRLVVYAVLA